MHLNVVGQLTFNRLSVSVWPNSANACGLRDWRPCEGEQERLTHRRPYVIVIQAAVSKAAMTITPSSVLSVRVSASERSLLEAAAEQARTSLSDFVRRKAIEAAEAAAPDRRIVTIAASDWERFEAWVDAPARDIPALRKLAASTPAWRD